LAKFASEAGEKVKNLEPVTSDADAIVEQLNHYKVCWSYQLPCNVCVAVRVCTYTDSDKMENESQMGNQLTQIYPEIGH